MRKKLNHDFWKLIIPIFLNDLFISIMGSVDAFLLSAYSDDAVAATGIVGRVIYIACKSKSTFAQTSDI